MRRREFITLLGGTAAAWPVVARAQTAMPVIGFLSSGSPDLFATRIRAFRQGLGEQGFVEGLNMSIEYRWSDGWNDRLPTMAKELVSQRVSLIAAGGIPGVLAAKAATETIPIVFQSGGDPIELGLVASLDRPSRNITGVASLGVELGPKRLELIREVAPNATTAALLINPTNANAKQVANQLHTAAGVLGFKVEVFRASTASEFNQVFSSLNRLKPGGLVIGADGYFNSQAGHLAALALQSGVPAIYQYRDFVAAGGLMSYGGSVEDAYLLLGSYAGRILKGEKPAELPVQQSTKIELFVNLKTAKALGIAMPLPLLGRANEVIE